MFYLESLLPPLLYAIAPGSKLGLSNLVTVIAFVILGYADAFIVLLLRCFLGAVFAGGITSLLYSLPAGLLSLTIQILLFRFVFPRLSLMSISFIGAVVHNLTQLFVASLIVNQNLMIALPVYLITGIAAGLFVGLAAYYIIRYLPKKVYLN